MVSPTGADIVVSRLERAGIEVAFGMCGHTNIALLEALADSSIRYISVRHEQVAAHAADAYFRAGRRPSALILHNGPGLTNALTGLGDAMADCSAVVAIVGDVASHHHGRDAFQEVGWHTDAGQWEVARPLVKRAWKVATPDRLDAALLRAITVALSGRPGPVLVSVPMDYFSRTIVSGAIEQPHRPHRYGQPGPVRGDREFVAAAAEQLRGARRPLLLAGGGALGAGAGPALLALARQLGAPIVTTLSGRGAAPEDDELVLGAVGRAGAPAANRAASEADVLFALGTQFPEQDSSSWVPGKTYAIPPTRLVHVDVDPAQIGKVYPATVAMISDARTAIEDVVEQLHDHDPAADEHWLRGLRTELTSWRAKHITSRIGNDAVPIDPARVLGDLRAVLPTDGIVIGDVGWGKNGTAQFFPVSEPNTMLVASGFGTMGLAASAVLGAKLACPQSPVVALTGDGGFSSCLSAVMTAKEYGIPVVWVVLNNGVFQSIMGLQERHYGRTVGTVFGEGSVPGYNPDFAMLAQACGVDAQRITDPADLGPTMRKALDSAVPFVLDVVVDPSATPIPTGYWDIHDIYDQAPSPPRPQ